MTKTLTEQWAVITPENCQEINAMISGHKKQIERLQEQISEANKLILWCARISWTGDQREDIFDKYLSKWGVK